MQGKHFIITFSLIASKGERANPVTFQCANELLLFVTDRKLKENNVTERKITGGCLKVFPLIYFVDPMGT